MQLKKNTLLFFLACFTTYSMDNNRNYKYIFKNLTDFLTENRDELVTNNIKNNTFITEINKINTLDIKDIIAIKQLSHESYKDDKYDHYEWFNRHIIEFLYNDDKNYDSLLFLCSQPNPNAIFDYINSNRIHNSSYPDQLIKQERLKDNTIKESIASINPINRYYNVISKYKKTILQMINNLSDIELINLYGMTNYINTMITDINYSTKDEEIELPQLKLCTYIDIKNINIKFDDLKFFIQKYQHAGLIILENYLYKKTENINTLLYSDNKDDIINFINYIITQYNNIIKKNQDDINKQQEVNRANPIDNNIIWQPEQTTILRTKEDIEYCPPPKTSVEDKNMKNNRHFLYILTGTAAIGVLIYYIIDYKKYYQTILEYTSNINNKISWNNLFY